MHLLLVSAIAVVCYATTIIMVISPKRIIVGCDSLVQKHKLDGTLEKLPNESKIHKVGPYFFCISGTLGEMSGKVFDARNIVRDAYVEGQSLAELLETAGPRLEAGFLQLLNHYRKRRRKYLKYLMTGRAYQVNATFFGIDNGPRVISYQFLARRRWWRVAIDVKKQTDYPTDGGPVGRYILIGQRTAIKEHIANTDRALLFKPSVPAAIENMISIEAHAFPEMTGLPCVILEVTEGGARWLKSAPFVPEL